MLRRCIILLLSLVALTVTAQRRVTPVENPDNKSKNSTENTKVTKPGERPASVIEMQDMEGHTILVDTILGVEYRDTILTTAPKLIYPRFHAVTVGVNLWDPLMRCFGQQYGGVGFWGELSLHNWIKPIVEAGIGTANYTPDDGNYKYKSSLAPFFKIGVNYNFLYNSNPDYSVYAGLRYGIANFSYEVTDVIVDQGYWGDNEVINIPSQRTTAGYFEFMVGIRVMIYKNFSLGWDLRFHKIAHQGTHLYGDPWYIPGYGTKGSSFSGSFSLSYTLPLRKPEPPVLPPGADE